MSKVIECKEDGDLPEEFNEAGKNGLLLGLTCGMEIPLLPEEFTVGGRCGVKYKIKEN
tara:strand:- start:530 stop:703 length:174 start_codon:yes stop_codon:yes gene_type:complete